jgi:hypothetical protein
LDFKNEENNCKIKLFNFIFSSIGWYFW